MRALHLAALSMVAWLAASPAMAEPVCLCGAEAVPSPLMAALRVELSARGMQSQTGGCCEAGESMWTVRFQTPDPLGATFVEVSGPDGTIRRAQIGEALDVVDARVFALSVASLFDAEPSIVAPEDDEPEPAREPAAEATPPERSERDEALPAPRRSSERITYSPVAFGIAAVGALLSDDYPVAGGALSLGFYLSPWFRFDVLMQGTGWQSTGEAFLSIGMGGLIDLAGRDTSLELGMGLAASFAGTPQGFWGSLGIAPYAGVLHRLEGSLMFSVRAVWMIGMGILSLTAESRLSIEVGIVAFT